MNKRVSLTFDSNDEIQRSPASSDDDSSTSLTLTNVPMTWERSTAGYRIIDLRNDRASLALDLITCHFFLEEPVCQATSLSRDVESLRSYRKLVKGILLGGTSVCAIREGEGSLVGLAVASIRRKTSDENHPDFPEGKSGALAEVASLKRRVFNEIRGSDDLEDVEEYVEVNVLFVDRRHRGRGVGTGLLRSCVEKAKSSNLPACIGLFSTDGTQRIAARLGFEKISEIPYSTYVPEENRKNPFASVGDENRSLACMIVKFNSRTPSTTKEPPFVLSPSEKAKK